MTAVEKVTVVGGTGDLGYGLALRLAAAGVAVAIGSRDAARAEAAAASVSAAVGGHASGGENAAVVAGADVVVLSVPFASQASTLKGIAPALAPGQVLLDVTVPLATAAGGRPTRTIGVWQGSAAQQAQELVPDGVHVVSGLHTVAASHLSALEQALEEDVLLCGDDAEAKRRAAALIERVEGLRCVDCGKLELARLTEQLTPLMIAINVRHKTSAGLRITNLPVVAAAGAGAS